MQIRPYRETDQDAVIALWREAFSDAPPWNPPEVDIQRKLSVQRDLFLVATIDETVVGSAMSGYDGHRGWVYYVAVHPSYQRQGIGRELMAAVEERLTRLGCPKINLQVRASNQAVAAFYQKLGYNIEERISMGKRLQIPQTST